LTQENKRRNIDEELNRSVECVKEAEVLQRSTLYSGAVSRLYYGVLHGVRALLLSKGLEARSHQEALQLLNMHFVKERVVDRETSSIFARLMKFREEADYDASSEFVADDYSQFKNEADLLLNKIREYLGKEQLL
jgi:uncharacterized protein (UPF0332 family)